MIEGYKLNEAHEILFSEISNHVDLFEARLKNKTFLQFMKESALNHTNLFSTFHWTSLIISIIVFLSLIIGYYLQTDEYKDPWILIQCMFIFLCVIVNTTIISLENNLRRKEVVHKIKRFLTFLKNKKFSENYLDLHNPISQCTSLQWTYRDSKIVNLPLGLLVKGDIILLRPGQIVPTKCKYYQVPNLETLNVNENLDFSFEKETYESKEIYRPTSKKSDHCSTSPRMHFSHPLEPQPFILLETPIIKDIEIILNFSTMKPYCNLDVQRFYIFSTLVERLVLPILWILITIIMLIRYLLQPCIVGTWPEMFLIIPMEIIFPLISLMFPVMWRFFDTLGIAKVILFSKHYAPEKSQQQSMSLISLNSDTNFQANTEFLFNLSSLFKEWWNIALGRCNSLPRTCNMLQNLGLVTSFSCIDKKGIISWPNPTAEKLFFFTKQMATGQRIISQEYDEEVISELTRSESTLKKSSLNNKDKITKNKSLEKGTKEASVHVLDLTYDVRYHYSLKFDEKSWSRYLSSLKPLGLSILLNTCNQHTVESYTQFADHVTCKSLKNMETVPVVNRRCFCQLAKQIGFKLSATNVFQTDVTFGIYQNPIKSENEVSHAVMPMSNMFSVVVKETVTNSKQIFCQGTADIVLGACSMYWDGEQLKKLSNLEKKKILDFYHRSSMSSYCTAFAYRPITESGLQLPKNDYIEIINEAYMSFIRRHMPAFRSHTIDAPSDNLLDHFLPPGYHGSAESLITKNSGDGNNSEQILQNYIFLGMVTMQYQAKQEIIELIESLESSCIRFVHFSKENELRSLIFSEKMGLEAGWNCHISLLSQNSPSSDSKSETSTQTKRCKNVENSENEIKKLSKKMLRIADSFDNGDSAVIIGGKGDSRAMDSGKKRLQLFHGFGTGGIGPKYISSPDIASDELNIGEEDITVKTSFLNKDQTKRTKPELDQHSSKISAYSIQGQIVQGQSDPRTSIQSVHNKSLLNQCNSSLTSFIDNPALLPKGINNIRLHLQNNVDNVPLQVSLFSDCTSKTTCEMIEILQEYGEVTCCLGSSSNIDNTKIFLQANCSIAIEPVHPYICINLQDPNFEHRLSGPMNMLMDYGVDGISVYKLNSLLLSLPCSLLLNSTCFPAISQITALARHHCYHMISMSHLFLSLQIYLSIHQLLSLPFTPPPIQPSYIFVASVFLIPCLASSMMGNAVDSNVAKCVQERFSFKLFRKLLFMNWMYYIMKILPNILICILCQILIEYNLCLRHLNDDNVINVNPTTNQSFDNSFQNNKSMDLISLLDGNFTDFNGVLSDGSSSDRDVKCHFLYGWMNNSTDGSWNNLNVGERKSTLIVSQYLISLQITIFFGIFSICSAHRLQHLWNQNPLKNKFLLIVLIVMLVLIFLFYPLIFYGYLDIDDICAIPSYIWVILFLTMPFNLILLECIKHKEIKIWIRHQKRVRLDFGTKLGMNSPF